RSAQGTLLLRCPAFEILAGAKRAARPGDHEAAHFLVPLAVFQRFEHFFVHLRHKRVQRLRPIQCNGRDAVLLLVEDGFVGHAEISLAYLPLNSGWRFSRNAFMPSLRSSEANSK